MKLALHWGWDAAGAAHSPLHLLVPSHGAGQGRAGSPEEGMAAALAGESLRAALWPPTPVLLSQLPPVLVEEGQLLEKFNSAHWFSLPGHSYQVTLVSLCGDLL